MNNLKKMFDENTRLVYSVFNEHLRGRPNADRMREDLLQIGMLSLWKCCTRFDPKKGVAFSTYAYNSIRKSMVCALVREGKKTACVVSIHKPVGDKEDGSITYEDVVASSVDVASEVEIDDLANQISQELGNNAKKVISMLRQGHTQVDIAKEMAMTRSSVSNILKKFREKVKNTLFFEN